MLIKLPVLALTGFGFLQGVFTQHTTTLNIFPGDADAVENLQGKVLGTGSDGTTYAVSGVVSGISVTGTGRSILKEFRGMLTSPLPLSSATLVEASTYLSEILVIETEGATALVAQACGLDENDSGLCTVVASGGAGGIETAVTSVIPWTFTLAPVAIEVTGSPDGDSSANSAVALPRFAAFVAAAPILGFIATLW
ncbi:hypothetical protein ACEPAI_6776 [Sanghuangporus weigelae]